MAKNFEFEDNQIKLLTEALGCLRSQYSGIDALTDEEEAIITELLKTFKETK